MRRLLGKLILGFTLAVLTAGFPVGVLNADSEIVPINAPILIGAPIEEAITEPEPEGGLVSVAVRIESESETLLDKHVSLPTGATALDALTELCGDDLVYTTSDYGAYIVSIFGIEDTDSTKAWMYAVNNVLSETGFDQYVLENQDSLVFYFIDWMYGSYAYFDQYALNATVGENVTLRLMGVHYMDGEFPVEGALINILGDNQDRRLYYTDENGYVTLPMRWAGIYIISANKINEDGINTISRPYSRIIAVPEFIKADTEAGTIMLYGELLETEMKPLTINGVTILPFRAVLEAMGVEVGWEPETQTVTANLPNNPVSFTLNDDLDGMPVIIIADRTYVPQSFIESLIN